MAIARSISFLLGMLLVGNLCGATLANQVLFAKVYANTRYFYPSKNISKVDWDHFLLKGLATIDTLAEEKQLLSAIQTLYKNQGLEITLQRSKPLINNSLPAENIKGKYWSYKGFGDSKMKLMFGPIIPMFIKHKLDYDKKLASINNEYLNNLAANPDIGYTDSSLVFSVDGIWMEIPFVPKRPNTRKISIAQTFPDYKLHSKVGLIQYWGALYLFFPYPIELEWETILTEALKRVDNGTPVHNVFRYIGASIKDAHAQIRARPYIRPIVTLPIDGKLTITGYHPSYADSSLVGAQIVSINGQSADSLLAEFAKLIPGKNDRSKIVTAAWTMTHEFEDSILDVAIVYPNNITDTLHLPIVGSYIIHPERVSVKTLLEGQSGVCYFDMTTSSGKQVIKAIESDDCKGIIIDLRQSYFGNLDFLAYLTDTPLTGGSSVIPISNYPERILQTMDTMADNDTIKSALGHKPDKVIVFLAAEESVSYRETILDIVKHYGLGTIIGTQTKGITGPIVLLSGWDGKTHRRLIFTGTLAYSCDGEIFHPIEPDIEVLATMESIKTNADEILTHAIEYVKERIKK